jgi:hypothetical protein
MRLGWLPNHLHPSAVAGSQISLCTNSYNNRRRKISCHNKQLSFQNHPSRRWNGLMCHRHGVTVSTGLSSTPACRPIVAPTKQRDAGACPDRHKDGTIVSGASKQTQASQFTQEIPDKNQSNLGASSSGCNCKCKVERMT